MLTLATFGLFSAGSGARIERYVGEHTRVGDGQLTFQRERGGVSRGRVFAVLLLAALAVIADAGGSPLMVLGAVLALLAPWLLAGNLAFDVRHVAYRGVRCRFVGTTGEVGGLGVLLGALLVLTGGLAYPYAQWRWTRFEVESQLLGHESLRWRTRLGTYYRTFAIAAGMTLVLEALPVLLFWSFASPPVCGDPRAIRWSTPTLATLVVIGGLLLVPAAYSRATLANAFYGGLLIGSYRFDCSQRFRELLKLYLMNAAAVVASAGLLTPWALVRVARYRAERLVLIRGEVETR